jgi:hypothetical protein
MAEKPTLNTFTELGEMLIQKYERYLPTAFDDTLSMLQKVNKVIEYVNQIGKLTNDVVKQWNEALEWILNEGIADDVNTRLDEMVVDGTLEQIINEALFDDLNIQITNLTQTVTDNKVASDTKIAADIETAKTAIEVDYNTKLSKKGFKYYGTPEDYGAIGDGVADDTDAVQNCLNENEVSHFNPVVYRVSKTIILPEGHSIEGNHAKLFVENVWTNVNNGVSVPQGTILFIKAREPVNVRVNPDYTKYVKNLRIEGDGSVNLTGIFMGTVDKSLMNQPSTVNFSVYGVTLENIHIAFCYNGLHLGEVWESFFNNIATWQIGNKALQIVGQSVNNTFVGCRFSTGGVGQRGVHINKGVYNGVGLRPEGISFIGGLLGYAVIGVEILDAFACKFSSNLVDLNSDYAVVIGSPTEDITFTDCYLAGSGGSAVTIMDNNDANQKGRLVIFKGCNFIPGTGQSAVIGHYQYAIFESCQFTKEVTFAGNAYGTVVNSIWNEVQTSNPRIVKSGSTKVYTNNNNFKLEATPIVVS